MRVADNAAGGGVARREWSREQVEAMLKIWGEYPVLRVDAAHRGYWDSRRRVEPGAWGRKRIGAMCSVAHMVEAAVVRLDGKLALILRQKYQWGMSDEEARRDERLGMGKWRYAAERERAVEMLGRVLGGGDGKVWIDLARAARHGARRSQRAE